MRIAICDDEASQIKYIRELIVEWAKKLGEIVSIWEFSSAEAFLFTYAEDKAFDLLLLDIQMKALDGVSLAREIRRDNEAVQIAFITGFSDYIAEGYEVSALHFLIKPVNADRLFPLLDRARIKSNRDEHEPALLVEENGEITRIIQRDIIYVEVFSPMVDIVTAERKYTIKANISDIEQKLDKNAFVRCHRSYIVGLRFVRRIAKNELFLDDDRRVPLSRRLYNPVHQAFINFYRRNA